MATWNIGHNITKYIDRLDLLTKYSEQILEEASYTGAKIVTDAIRKNAEGLTVTDYNTRPEWVATYDPYSGGLTPAQKKGILKGMGLSKFDNDRGYVQTKMGLDGYNDIKTPRWPNGQPNAVIARSLEKGQSWLPKQPFIARAVRAKREEATFTIAKELDKSIERRMR